jgi:flagellar biosynthesis protein FliR
VLTLLEQYLYPAVATGLRVAGLMSFAPFFGGLSIPIRIKAVLTLAITAVLYPISGTSHLHLTPIAWSGIVFSEVMFGLTLGLCLQFVFDGALLAGQLTGFQFSFSLVNIIDPQTNVDTPVFSIFHQLLVLLIFLQLNVHHWLLRGLASSFEFVPVGTFVLYLSTVKGLLHAAGSMWVIGVEIAAPILISTLLLDLAIGFLSKVSPQMPAILFSIPLKSLAGYGVLAIAIGFWPGLFERHFSNALAWSERLLHLGS